MRILRWVAAAAVSVWTGLPGSAGALVLTIDENFALNGAPVNAEGVAVIASGTNAGIYIPHDLATGGLGRVTVLDVTTGAFLYNFSVSFGNLNAELRSIDVLPNGNLIIGQHDDNLVREFVIPPNPMNGTVPAAALGTIDFAFDPHPDNNQPFDEFEAISAFRRPSDGQVYLLIAEEGRTLPGQIVPPGQQPIESPGEVYLAPVSGTGFTSFTKLFSVPLADNFDDISGLDVINIAFDGAGNIDYAGSTVLMTDDSSGAQSGAFVLNLLGQILETLDGPGTSAVGSFESEFEQPWRDAEGADYNAETGTITVFFSDGADGTPAIVKFASVIEAPPAPEPATFGLIGLGLAAVALLRTRR